MNWKIVHCPWKVSIIYTEFYKITLGNKLRYIIIEMPPKVRVLMHLKLYKLNVHVIFHANIPKLVHIQMLLEKNFLFQCVVVDLAAFLPLAKMALC